MIVLSTRGPRSHWTACAATVYTSVGMTSVIILQHAACEAPGTIAHALERANVAFDVVHSGAGQPVPRELEDAAGLVVMGGPMGVYETQAYPYLRAELALLELALARELPVLGVCLGSQLLAAALGARVYATGHKELGWYPVQLKEGALQHSLFAGVPEQFTALHWHGDAFELPATARSLAASELTEHQAFGYGPRAYGVLFHLEVTLPHVKAMAEAFPDELAVAGVSTPALLEDAGKHLPALLPIATRVFDAFATSCARAQR